MCIREFYVFLDYVAMMDVVAGSIILTGHEVCSRIRHIRIRYSIETFNSERQR